MKRPKIVETLLKCGPDEADFLVDLGLLVPEGVSTLFELRDYVKFLEDSIQQPLLPFSEPSRTDSVAVPEPKSDTEDRFFVGEVDKGFAVIDRWSKAKIGIYSDVKNAQEVSSTLNAEEKSKNRPRQYPQTDPATQAKEIIDRIRSDHRRRVQDNARHAANQKGHRPLSSVPEEVLDIVAERIRRVILAEVPGVRADTVAGVLLGRFLEPKTVDNPQGRSPGCEDQRYEAN